MLGSLLRWIAALCLIASFAAPVAAQRRDPPPSVEPKIELPALLANCEEVGSLASPGRHAYNRCFDYGPGDYYGRIFVQFDIPGLSDQGLVANLKRSEQRSILRRLGELFASNSRDGSLIAEITVQREGLPDMPPIHLELAKFTHDGKGKFNISQSSAALNGYVGPIFNANAQTRITVETSYVSNKTQFIGLTSLIEKASQLLRMESFLGTKAKVSEKTLAAIKEVEDAIAANYSFSGTSTTRYQLDFDPNGTSARFSAVDFNKVISRPEDMGKFFFGAVRLRSTLVDVSPDEVKPLVYTNGGYGMLAINPITNRLVSGQRLRDYVATAMGERYVGLRSNDVNTFIAAAVRLNEVVEESTLMLTAPDQLAAQWAFTVDNPLMNRRQVRMRMPLYASEVSGDLDRLALALPPIDTTALTDPDAAIITAAKNAGDEADRIVIEGAPVITRAEAAAARGRLPVANGGHIAVPEVYYDYAGETPGATPFHGQLTDRVPERFGNVYVGSMILSGTTPVFEGFGRYRRAIDRSDPAFVEYVGQVSANYFAGYGVVRFADGSEFHGQMSLDEPNGYGVLYTADGTTYFARYQGGQPGGWAVRKQRKAGGSLSEFVYVPGRWAAGQFVEGRSPNQFVVPGKGD